MSNVVEHAKAGKVSIRLETSRFCWLRLTVKDDGDGFDVEKPFDGLGIGTMQDYAEAVDGRCSIQSEPGTGTEVTAVLPALAARRGATTIPGKRRQVMELLKESCPWCHKEVRVEPGASAAHMLDLQKGVHLHA